MAWTDIPDVDVEAGGIPKGSTITAIRDNFAGMGARDSGAPKISGAIYNFQEFTTSGTWTKPSNAETGDWVFVEMVGGGASGAVSGSTGTGGGGGGGLLYRFDDIDDLGATETVVVGAGGAVRTSGGGENGRNGTSSTFGTASTEGYLVAGRGLAGLANGTSPAAAECTIYTGSATRSLFWASENAVDNEAGKYGGGGGGTTGGSGAGGSSIYAGRGGDPGDDADAENGEFPGGGGGGVSNRTGTRTSGAGADGRVRVWCMKP